MIWGKVRTPNCSWSDIVHPSITTFPSSQLNSSDKDIFPDSNAAVAATILNVDPGSNWSVTTLFFWFSNGEILGAFRSKSGREAIAKIFPFWGFIKMPIAPFASDSSILLCNSSWRMLWYSISIVSCIFDPSIGFFLGRLVLWNDPLRPATLICFTIQPFVPDK